MPTTRNVIVVAGARPNFMKVAPILRAMERTREILAPRLVHTGQHYDQGMSDVFFEQLRIPKPDVHLEVGPGTHGAQTARILERFEQLLIQERESTAGVVVVGDVNSTVACTLAATKLSIPVAHVEAGLRSRDRTMPEEINRIVTDAIADLLLLTEESGRENLRQEGVPESRMVMVGNVMIDTLHAELETAQSMAMWTRFSVSPKSYGLITLHRPSNVDEPVMLEELIGLLRTVSDRLPLIFPIHPRTKKRIEESGGLDRLTGGARIVTTDPLGYHESLSLLSQAAIVLTDSGGIQEETSVLGVPCLTLRPNTERPVTVTHGTNTLIAGDHSRVLPLVEDVLAGRYKRGGEIPYWDGKAAERIAAVLLDAWG